MADNTTQGLLQALGMGQDPYQQANLARKARLSNADAGNGQFASAFNAGRQLGSGGAQAAQGLAGGLLGGIGGLISGKDGGRSLQGFSDNVARSGQSIRQQSAAAELGVSQDQFNARQKTQEQVSALNMESSGDSIKDQIAMARRVAQIANRNGDAETAGKALQQITKLKAQELEFEKAALANKKAQREDRLGQETDSTGRSLFMQGDNRAGAPSTGRLEEDGTWTVFRPDGSVEEGVDGDSIQLMDPKTAAGGPTKLRQFETRDAALKHALNVNGLGGQAINKPRSALMDMGEQSVVVSDMAQSLLDMYNPELAFSESATAATGADRVMSFVESAATLFDRGDGKPLGYEGKRTTAQKQYELATEAKHLESYLSNKGLTMRNILPEHIQEDTREAQLFIANVMQLAYLDARLQEPANRGLSDSDVERALQRIGVSSPNPDVFVDRQLQILNRLENRMSNLGLEYQSSSEYIDNSGNRSVIDSNALRSHVFAPEMTGRVSSQLAGARNTLNDFRQKRGDVADTASGPIDTTNMSLDEQKALLEQLKAQRAALEGAQ